MKGSTKSLRSPYPVACLLLLVAWFWTGTPAQGQALQSAVIIAQNTQWLPQNEAIAKLKSEILTLQQQFATLPINSAEYYDSLRRQIFYKAIVKAIQEGASIPAAMDASVNTAATLGGTQEVAATPKGVLRALYNQTRLLLSS